MESPPLSYPYGESMSDFYSHRQQWLNYEKSGKPIGYPIFPLTPPSPLLRTSRSRSPI